jgi:peptide/nickel transport system substrate-binding protein
MAHSRKVLLVLAALLVAIATLAGAQTLPVPRNQAVVVETDTAYQNLNVANPTWPAGNGTQWGSGWHQVVNEWDWYMDYATGKQRLWRTTGWEYNKDYTQLTWHVRKGVTWNDGVPYTAQDIVWTMNLYKNNTDLSGSGMATNIDSVSAPDDYTVIFKFKAADPRWHQNMRMWGGSQILAKHVYEKEADVRTFKNWPPVETGPFKLQNYYSDLGMYVWQYDTNWWAAKVMGMTMGPKYIVFRKAPPPDLDLQDFVKGNVDALLPHIFPNALIKAAQKQWTHTVTSPYMDAVAQGIMAFNTQLAPTNDVKFRWAVQYLLNRDKLAKIYPMADSTAVTMWPWPAWQSDFKWQIPAIQQKYGPLLRYDPAQAAKALDAAGYKKGSDGLRKLPDGKAFTLILWAGAAPDVSNQQATDFADECRKIGIDVVLKINGQGWTEQQARSGQGNVGFDVLDIYTAFPGDPWQFIDSWTSKWAKPLGTPQTGGDRGGSRLQDPKLDAIADKMRSVNPDDPSYLGLVQQALDIWYTDLPAVPATEKTFVQTFSDLYWTGWPTTGNWYEVPYQWWPSSIFMYAQLKPTGK